MKKLIALFLIAFPLFFTVDLLNGSYFLDNYVAFWKEYFLLAAVTLISWSLIKKNKLFKFEMMEDVRVIQFFHEVERYNNTPFIAPLMMLYMKTPPTTVRNTNYDYVHDTFYRTVVTAFRDRVYVLMDYSQMEPDERKNLLSIVGLEYVGKMALYYLAPIVWTYYAIFILKQSLLTSWPVLTIPLIVYCLHRATIMMTVLIEASQNSVEDLEELHGVKNMKVTWRESFPDTEIGVTFHRAYYMEIEKRARYDYTLKGQAVPAVLNHWPNKNFAPYIYPSPSLPVWEGEYQAILLNKQTVIESTSDNVIAFKKA